MALRAILRREFERCATSGKVDVDFEEKSLSEAMYGYGNRWDLGSVYSLRSEGVFESVYKAYHYLQGFLKMVSKMSHHFRRHSVL